MISSTSKTDERERGVAGVETPAERRGATSTQASSSTAGRSANPACAKNVTDAISDAVAEQRRARGMRVSELARLVGVSPSLISQIERGQSRPSVSTLFSLAEALSVPIDVFFGRENVGSPAEQAHPGRESPAGVSDGLQNLDERPQPGERRYLVRRAARAAIDIEGGVRWERLTPTTLDHVEFMELVYAPGSESHGTLYRHSGSEMVLVTSGQLDIYVGFDCFQLRAGDSIHFPSSLPHRYVNPGREVARAVTVILHDDAPPSDLIPRRP
jgi:transcriptional regulator with XRE-family HTH domain